MAIPQSPTKEMDTHTQALFDGLRAGEARMLAKAITLLESNRSDHRQQASQLLNALLPHTGTSLRMGISGSPGVGKSTFIEAMGLEIISRGYKLAVLAVDPSSQITGGSIMGDKTRMELLSREKAVFIRPSPAGSTLGGVHRSTRESILACEAAGFNLILVETVGVGQSETTVAEMVDLFVLLQLPNAGDDLQAIKKGIMELADLIVINKADLDPRAADRAAQQISSALHLVKPIHPEWPAKVLQCSALQGNGISEFCDLIKEYQTVMDNNGRLLKRRQNQNQKWMWSLIDLELRNRFRNHGAVKEQLEGYSQAVARGEITASDAADRVLGLFF